MIILGSSFKKFRISEMSFSFSIAEVSLSLMILYSVKRSKYFFVTFAITCSLKHLQYHWLFLQWRLSHFLKFSENIPIYSSLKVFDIISSRISENRLISSWTVDGPDPPVYPSKISPSASSSPKFLSSTTIFLDIHLNIERKCIW